MYSKFVKTINFKKKPAANRQYHFTTNTKETHTTLNCEQTTLYYIYENKKMLQRLYCLCLVVYRRKRAVEVVHLNSIIKLN